jgi:hypothetical protein
MPYKTGTWGEQAKTRSTKRREYFRDYARRKYDKKPKNTERHHNRSIEDIKTKRQQYDRDYYTKNKERIQARKHEYNRKNDRGRQYKIQNPEKIKAQAQARYRIVIPEGQLCEECGKHPAKHRHHPDYSKPLEVKFLCASCNKKAKSR